jgi:nitrite reductase (NO-forming)/hydroxylamine reductase
MNTLKKEAMLGVVLCILFGVMLSCKSASKEIGPSGDLTFIQNPQRMNGGVLGGSLFTPFPPVDLPEVPEVEAQVRGVAVSQYFQDSCSGCHGVHREGTIGPALIPQRLTELDAYYFGVIQNGKPGTVMPPWGGVLTADEINTLIAFIRSEPASSSLEWTLEDIQNSLVEYIPESALPAIPLHSGNMDNLMLVTEREIGSITVIDGDTHTFLSRIPASYRTHGYAFSPVNERWVYNIGRDGVVFKIDLYSMQSVRKVRVGLDSRGLALSDDGQFLIAGNYIPATAVILDADTLEPLKVIETVAENPEGEVVASRVAIVSDVSPELVGPYFIIALKEAGQLWRIDFSDSTFPINTLSSVGHILHDGFLSPDNTRFYIASQGDHWMAVVDVAQWTLIDQIETGATPHPGSGAVWSFNQSLYGGTVHLGVGQVSIWNLENNTIVGTVPTSGPGLFIRSHEESPYIWADATFAEVPTITVFEKAPPFQTVGILSEGRRTLHPEFTQNGDFVYISDWDGNVVRVYNATTLAWVATIPNLTTPTGIFNSSRRQETLGH